MFNFIPPVATANAIGNLTNGPSSSTNNSSSNTSTTSSNTSTTSSNTYDSNYFNDKYITLEEPRVRLFNGNYDSHNSAGFDGDNYEIPTYYGTYNTCFQSNGNDCIGSQTISEDLTKSLTGMWVPPNKYVYLYSKYSGDLGSIKDANIIKDNNGNPVEYTKEWLENEAKSYKLFCDNPNSETPVKIINAKYQCINDNRNTDVTNNKHVINKLGLGAANWNWPYNNLNDYFGDPCDGVAKKLTMKYNCGTGGNWLPPNKPNGIYTPGFYNSLEASSDPTINSLLPVDDYNTNINKFPPNTNINKSIIIRPIDAKNGIPPKWKDHLADCCSGKINNKTLCGTFMPNHEKGSKSCSFLFDEKTTSPDGKINRTYLNIDDIKDITDDGNKPAGKYNWICKKDPTLCDNIKKEFCSQTINANSPWCDCINASTRSEYIDLKKRLNLANLPAYINKCMMASCRTDDNDLSKNFILSNELGKECPTPEQIQQVIVSGSNNVLENVGQIIDKDDEKKYPTTNPINPTNPPTTNPTNPPTTNPTKPPTTNPTNSTNNTSTNTVSTTFDTTTIYIISGVFIFLLLIIFIIVITMQLRKKSIKKKIH
jgi:hypothetical protein